MPCLVKIKTTNTIDTSITHIRPRFKFSVPGTPKVTMDHVRKLLDESPENIHGKIVGDHIILDIVGDDVHFWSPQLNFRVEENPDAVDETIVAGLIGPRPNVWTLFMFVYFSVGVAGFFISSYGISRYMVGEHSYAVWGLPLAALFMLTAYQAGKFGEKLGEDQVELLKQFVREAVK